MSCYMRSQGGCPSPVLKVSTLHFEHINRQSLQRSVAGMCERRTNHDHNSAKQRDTTHLPFDQDAIHATWLKQRPAIDIPTEKNKPDWARAQYVNSGLGPILLIDKGSDLLRSIYYYPHKWRWLPTFYTRAATFEQLFNHCPARKCSPAIMVPVW
jgi:hypothetical protein